MSFLWGWGGTVEATQKNGKTILLTIGWLSIVLLTINIIPPLLLFFPICIGVVLRRDYECEKQGAVMITLGVISSVIGYILGLLVMNLL